MTKRAKACLFSSNKDSEHNKEEKENKVKVPEPDIGVLEVSPPVGEEGELCVISTPLYLCVA
jgi:hypothetical protein